jgi:hypothetical protein
VIDSGTPIPWSSVGDAAEFAAFVGKIADSLHDIRFKGSRWAADDAVWGSTDRLPVFLHTWARWLDSTTPWAATLETGTPLAEPSWQSLAFQLAQVLDASPPDAPPDARVVRQVSEVVTGPDFAAWLRYMGDDCIDEDAELTKAYCRGQWAFEGDNWKQGGNLADFLNSWSSMLSALGPARSPSLNSWAELARLVVHVAHWE